MKKPKINNPRADEPTGASVSGFTASANEATGMMYAPPLTDSELDSIRDLHGLQSTEFAATEFGEDETGLDFDVPDEVIGYQAGKERSGCCECSRCRDKSTDGGETDDEHGYNPGFAHEEFGEIFDDELFLSGFGGFPAASLPGEGLGRLPYELPGAADAEFAREFPDEYNSALAQIDPDVNYVNSSDSSHASMKPLSFVDFSNGESQK